MGSCVVGRMNFYVAIVVKVLHLNTPRQAGVNQRVFKSQLPSLDLQVDKQIARTINARDPGRWIVGDIDVEITVIIDVSQRGPHGRSSDKIIAKRIGE